MNSSACGPTNQSAAAIADVLFDDMATCYEAYQRFGEIVEDEAMEVIVPAGARWLQGCYADKDGLHSTLVALKPGQLDAAARSTLVNLCL